MAQTKGVDYAAQKQHFLKELDGWTGTVTELAAKHELNKMTAYRWASVAKKKAKRTSKKKRRGKTRQASIARNGRVSVPPPPPPRARVTPASAPSLDSVHADLTRALASVDAMREAFGRVFGGAP